MGSITSTTRGRVGFRTSSGCGASRRASRSGPSKSTGASEPTSGRHVHRVRSADRPPGHAPGPGRDRAHLDDSADFAAAVAIVQRRAAREQVESIGPIETDVGARRGGWISREAFCARMALHANVCRDLIRWIARRSPAGVREDLRRLLAWVEQDLGVAVVDVAGGGGDGELGVEVVRRGGEGTQATSREGSASETTWG